MFNVVAMQSELHKGCPRGINYQLFALILVYIYCELSMCEYFCFVTFVRGKPWHTFEIPELSPLVYNLKPPNCNTLEVIIIKLLCPERLFFNAMRVYCHRAQKRKKKSIIYTNRYRNTQRDTCDTDTVHLTIFYHIIKCG